MSKTFKIYGFVLFAILLLLGVLELSKKPAVNWRKNFDPAQKSPFGLFVFAEEANTVFNGKLIKEKKSPFDYYSENKNPGPHNILIVQRDIDTESWKKIHQQVAAGASVFYATTDYPRYLKDSLSFVTGLSGFGQKSTLKLTDRKFLGESLYLDKFPDFGGFTSFSKQHEILGTGSDEEGSFGVNFIKVAKGKGAFYLHSEPLFLTNYYLLKTPGSSEYLQKTLGYLPDQKTVWFIGGGGEDIAGNELSFILSKPSLRYAWWLFLAGLLIFVIFNFKRKQRKIPIIEPKRNKSVEFVQSVGNLYLQEGDFHDMMAKKAQYFLHHVRLDLQIDTAELNDEFIGKLQVKTGKDRNKIQEAVDLIKKARDPYSNVTKEDLFSLNKMLDDILKAGT